MSEHSYIFDNRKLQLLWDALESGHVETVFFVGEVQRR